MKKIMALLTVLMCFASVSTFAQEAFSQEVRGIETRRVEYQYQGDIIYGFEFHNANSVKVSVDIELYNENNKLVATKTIVLAPNETYVFKRNDLYALYKHNYSSEFYHVKYKAYKLQ